MLRSLHHRTFRRLYVAQVVSLLGTGLTTVALALLAYDLAGARAGLVLGTAFTIKMLAYVFVAPLAAAAVENLPRRSVLVGSELARVAIALMLPLVQSIWQVYVLVFILQAASATFTPVMTAAIPQILPDETEYTEALSLSRLATDLESVVSPMLAGLALLAVDHQTLFLGTAIGFALSALVLSGTAIPSPAPPASGRRDSAPLLSRARKGLGLFVSTPALRPVVAIHMAVAAVEAYVLVQTVVLVRIRFGMPEGHVGWALAVNGAGSMLAALCLPMVMRRQREHTVMLSGALLLALAATAIPLALRSEARLTGLATLLVLWFVIGIGWSTAEVPVGLLIKRSLAPADLPAAFAAQFSLEHACWLLTYPLVGWLGSRWLDQTPWFMAGLAFGCFLLAALLWLPRRHPTADALAPHTAYGRAHGTH